MDCLKQAKYDHLFECTCSQPVAFDLMRTAALGLLLLLLCFKEATSECPKIHGSLWGTLQEGLCFSVTLERIKRTREYKCILRGGTTHRRRSKATCSFSKEKNLWMCFCPYGDAIPCLEALGNNLYCKNWNDVKNLLEKFLIPKKITIPSKKTKTSTSTIKTRKTPKITQLITRARPTTTTMTTTKTTTTTTIATIPTTTTTTTTSTTSTTTTTTKTTTIIITTTTTTPTTTTTTTPTTIPPTTTTTTSTTTIPPTTTTITPTTTIPPTTTITTTATTTATTATPTTTPTTTITT
ncbi:hypothetical protein GCK32_008436, partial [Trichostrongylus colubriformis]